MFSIQHYHTHFLCSRSVFGECDIASNTFLRNRQRKVLEGLHACLERGFYRYFIVDQ